MLWSSRFFWMRRRHVESTIGQAISIAYNQLQPATPFTELQKTPDRYKGVVTLPLFFTLDLHEAGFQTCITVLGDRHQLRQPSAIVAKKLAYMFGEDILTDPEYDPEAKEKVFILANSRWESFVVPEDITTEDSESLHIVTNKKTWRVYSCNQS